MLNYIKVRKKGRYPISIVPIDKTSFGWKIGIGLWKFLKGKIDQTCCQL